MQIIHLKFKYLFSDISCINSFALNCDALIKKLKEFSRNDLGINIHEFVIVEGDKDKKFNN